MVGVVIILKRPRALTPRGLEGAERRQPMLLRGGFGFRLGLSGLCRFRRRGLDGCRLCFGGKRGDFREGGGIAGRQLGEALAIERAARGFQAGDQLSVGEPVLARRGIDAHDPQAAEVALLAAASDIGIAERLIDRLLRRSVQLALGLVEPLRALEKLLPLRAPYGSSFYSRHCDVSSYLFVGQHSAQRRSVCVGNDVRAAHLALAALRLARKNVALSGFAALELARRGFSEALRGASMCLDLRHDE